jgi:hypothetical protein
MKGVLIYFLLFAVLSTILLCGKIKIKQNYLIADLTFEYPYTCGTWFNRGKNTCNDIKNMLEKNSFKVYLIVHAFHVGESPKDFDGNFNIYLNRNGDKILLATSNDKSPFYHAGLKYFAYTYYTIDEKKGEKIYMEEYPQKESMMAYILKRTLDVLNP